jgi:hypothetical protein
MITKINVSIFPGTVDTNWKAIMTNVFGEIDCCLTTVMNQVQRFPSYATLFQ